MRPQPQVPAEQAVDPSAPTGLEQLSEATTRPRLARCECRTCGAHCNAIAAIDVHASCPNCGGSRLVPVEGAGIIVAR